MAPTTANNNDMLVGGDVYITTTTSRKGSGKKSHAQVAAEIANLPYAYDEYFAKISKNDKTAKAPQAVTATGKEISDAVGPKFDEAVKSNDKPLNKLIEVLKVGQACVKLVTQSPFWACGFKRATAVEEPEETFEPDDNSPSAELND